MSESVNPDNSCASLETGVYATDGDKLEEMLSLQSRLQSLYGAHPDDMDAIDRQRLIGNMTLAATDELHEFLNRTPWKPWKVYRSSDFDPTPDELKEIKMELVDVLHFWMVLCLAFNMSADEIFGFYMAKNKENIDRLDRGYSKKQVSNIKE